MVLDARLLGVDEEGADDELLDEDEGEEELRLSGTPPTFTLVCAALESHVGMLDEDGAELFDEELLTVLPPFIRPALLFTATYAAVPIATRQIARAM